MYKYSFNIDFGGSLPYKAIALSFWLCSSSIHSIWIEWKEKPVKMSFSEEPVSISSIPFPTVTFCPETKVTRHKFKLSPLNEARYRPNPLNLTDIQ